MTDHATALQAPEQGAAPAKRVGHRWAKGQSGNPGGRVKTVERLARDFLAQPDDARDAERFRTADGRPLTRRERLFAMLFDMATGEGFKSSDRIAAARLLIERADGLPRAVVALEAAPTDEVIDAECFTEDELRAIVAADALVVGASRALPAPVDE